MQLLRRFGHGAPESPRPSDLQILVLERNVLLRKDHDVIAEKHVSGESILNRLLGSASMAPARSRADSRIGRQDQNPLRSPRSRAAYAATDAG